MARRTQRERPNILFMVSHDLGRHLNCYGVEAVNSPRLDALAGEGIRLARSFCTAPQCSPSRASIFTGRYPHNNGVMGLTHGDFGWDLHDDERHLAGILRHEGYETAHAGGPHECRRQEYFGLGERVRLSSNLADGLAEGCRELIRAQRNADQPFYLQVGFVEPHRLRPGFGHAPDTSRGIFVPPYLVDDLDARDDFAYYQGAVRVMDAAVGCMLDALEETGQAENTLVIFTVDHGIPFPRAKCSLYDPGLETGFIARYAAAGLSGGKVLDPLISNIDYLPTVLELLGIDVPRAVQGRSFLPLIRGEGYEARREVFGEMTYHDYCDPRRCIRTEAHKLIANFTTAPFFMDPSQAWRRPTITRDPEDPPYAYHPHIELYDLREDPLETQNLAGQPEATDIQNDLLARLHRWMEETEDPLLEGIPMSPHHKAALAFLRGE